MNTNTDLIIDQAVNNVFQRMSLQAVSIKQAYFQAIQKELLFINQYVISKTNINLKQRTDKLKNPYAPEYGFMSPEEFAYEIQATKKEQAIIYNRINNILSYLRNCEHINYTLYIKSGNNYYRYSVPENEIDNFTAILQSNSFKNQEELRQLGEVMVKRLENAMIMSQHIQNYLKAVDEALQGTNLKLKLADKYEAFEYHYQKIDMINGQENFEHNFNIPGIKNWLLARRHDTVGWYARGDIGLTSVKSINLNNKFLFLSLASQQSLNQTYALLKTIFSSQLLSQQDISRLTKAFTPVVDDLKRGIEVDVEQIVVDLIKSLQGT